VILPEYKNLVDEFAYDYDNLFYRFSIKVPGGYWFRHFPESRTWLTAVGFSDSEFEEWDEAKFWLRVIPSDTPPEKLLEKNDGKTLTIEFPRSAKSYFQLTGPTEYYDVLWSIYGSLEKF
jgi:hypothetical protein